MPSWWRPSRFSKRLQRQFSFPDHIVKQGAGDDPFDGIHHGVQLGFVDIVVPDDQRNGPGRLRIDDGAQAMLLAVENEAGVRFRNDGEASVVIDDLDQEMLTSTIKDKLRKDFKIGRFRCKCPNICLSLGL